MKALCRTAFSALMLGIILNTLGCAGPVTRTLKDQNADLAAYRTYEWLSQDDVMNLRLQNPSIDFMAGTVRIERRPEKESIVRTSIEKDLKQEGYRPSTGSQPDFYVTFYAKAKDEDWISSWRGDTPGVNGVPLVIFPNYDRALADRASLDSVYVVFYDANTKKPSWVGRIDGSRITPRADNPELAKAMSQLIHEFRQKA